MSAVKLSVLAFMVWPLAGAALASTSPPTLQDRRSAACYGDVQRLCADAMPDVARVTACMKPKKALVSAKCRALWDVK